MTIRKVVELTFADEGIDVTTAADADAAMQRFVEIQPDIVLVDVGLAITNGYRICEMIKTDEATKHIPVLLLVGSFEPFDQDEAERVLADGFLTKPFHSIRDLVTRVKELLGSQIPLEASAMAAGTDASQQETYAATPEMSVAEASDIDDLYKSSFASTVEIEEFDTLDDLLDGSGLDDEMIEASHPVENLSENPSEDPDSEGNGEEIKAFDWSPAEIIETDTTAETAAASYEPETEIDTDETNNEREPALEHPAPDASVNAGFGAFNGGSAEMSPEFINLVAQRVVERLSDKVIREIAQVAVPLIAEKLIREALDEEKSG